MEAPALPGTVPCTQLAPVPCTQVAKIIDDDENWARMMNPLVERNGH